jgi:hypothetical protein
MTVSATIIIERFSPPHPWADERGNLELWVDGDVGPYEAPSRHCPGDPGSVDLMPGPYRIASGPHKGKYTRVTLTAREEQRAEEALREAAHEQIAEARSCRRRPSAGCW